MLLATLLLLANLQQQQQAKPETPVFTAAELDLYTGSFQDEHEPDVTVSVYRDGDHLAIDSEHYPPLPLRPVNRTDFVGVGAPVPFTFFLGKDGRAQSIRVVAPEKAFYKRIGEAVPHHFRDYSLTEEMIPMRDGVRLHALIARPTDTKVSLPIVLERTPYGATMPAGGFVYVRHPELAKSGYIFVISDIRGRYKSEGDFVMYRPLADPKSLRSVDESTDAYDTVDWLLKNLSNHNGCVGVVGLSYNGRLAMEAGINPHPAVKAISPQAPVIDLWLGDDDFHNGAFRQTVNYSYVLRMESSKDESAVGVKLPDDEYGTYLNAGSFGAMTRNAPNPNLPSWVDYLRHPSIRRLLACPWSAAPA